MFTVDASVWVNGFDQREPGHEASREFLATLRLHAIPIVVPNLVLAEVAGAISRTRSLPAEAQEFASALGELPNVTVIAMDLALAHQALAIAGEKALRGADAVYAAVAVQTGTTLVTLDREQLTRLAGTVRSQTPTAALATLSLPPAPRR